MKSWSKWTEQEDSILKGRYENTPNIELATLLNKTVEAIKKRGQALRLRKSKEYWKSFTIRGGIGLKQSRNNPVMDSYIRAKMRLGGINLVKSRQENPEINDKVLTGARRGTYLGIVKWMNGLTETQRKVWFSKIGLASIKSRCHIPYDGVNFYSKSEVRCVKIFQKYKLMDKPIYRKNCFIIYNGKEFDFEINNKLIEFHPVIPFFGREKSIEEYTEKRANYVPSNKKLLVFETLEQVEVWAKCES